MDSKHLDSLADNAKILIEQLQNGDEEAALKTVEQLNQTRDVGLYEEVGKLTRSLHDAIVNFHIDANTLGADGSPEATEVSAMEDATDRLSYVINLTENAANKTMDMVEETIPISEEISDTATKLKGDWQKLINRELNGDEFRNLYKDMDKFLDFTTSRSVQIGGNLSNILLAQDYQDLTGQVIKKVIDLVNDVESKLVDLVKVASSVDEITGVVQEAPGERAEVSGIEAEGPLMRADKRADVVTSQDDVDDLLSSLGF